MNTRESLPTPPFKFYRILPDNVLLTGIAKGIYFFKKELESLVGSVNFTYPDELRERKLTPDEYCSCNYAVDLKLSVEDAWKTRIKDLEQSIEFAENSIERATDNYLDVIDKKSTEIDKKSILLRAAKEQLLKNEELV
jgi:hypothetical protein